MKKIAIALALFTTGVQAAEFKDADIKQYDCSMPTLQHNDGKCLITITADGKDVVLKASPEVGAPWGNSYGDSSCRPMSKLSLAVDNGEILTVLDGKGRKVSTKFDYSR